MLYTLENARGIKVSITPYGGIVTGICLPDEQSGHVDAVLGYKTVESYLRDTHYLGAVIGRYCNRIGNARFVLDRDVYPLAANSKPGQALIQLHGGPYGFNTKLWDATQVYI